jgi:putative oxidoreductase
MNPKLANLGLLLLRLTFGLQLALLHGLPKAQSFAAKASSWADPLHIGPRNSLIGTIAGELVCSVLLAVGLATRLAALGVAFTMAVAAFLVHRGFAWGPRELAMVYLAAALAIAALGPGRYSLDAVLRKGGGKAQVRAGKAPKPARAA